MGLGFGLFTMPFGKYDLIESTHTRKGAMNGRYTIRGPYVDRSAGRQDLFDRERPVILSVISIIINMG